MIRRHLFISGKVQGVFFRDSCRRKAEELAVKGWVRNTAEGVEVVVEGEEEKVSQLVEWCREGPAAAEVEKVKVEEEDFQGEFEGFGVRY